jgi:hypothetical protein
MNVIETIESREALQVYGSVLRNGLRLPLRDIGRAAEQARMNLGPSK